MVNMNVMKFYFKKFKNSFKYYSPTTVYSPPPIPIFPHLSSTQDSPAPAVPLKKE